MPRAASEAGLGDSGAAVAIVGCGRLPLVRESVSAFHVGGDAAAPTCVQGGRVPRAPAGVKQKTAGLRWLGRQPEHQKDGHAESNLPLDTRSSSHDAQPAINQSMDHILSKHNLIGQPSSYRFCSFKSNLTLLALSGGY